MDTLMDRLGSEPNTGYDAARGEYVDMIEAGIIDTAKVLKTALGDAASVASLLVTTEVAITDEPKRKGDPRKLNPYEQSGRAQDNWKYDKRNMLRG